MFEKFSFTDQQVKRFYLKAIRDFELAKGVKEVEIIFVFTYEAMLKVAIAVCAKNNLRVKARRGHHIELLDKMAEILKDADIGQISNGMRSKRNRGLYSAGDMVSRKEAEYYRKFVEQILKKADTYLFPNKLL